MWHRVCLKYNPLTLRQFRESTAIAISTPQSSEMITFHFSNGVIQMAMDLSPFLSQHDVVQNLDFGSHQGSAGLTGRHMQQVFRWNLLKSWWNIWITLTVTIQWLWTTSNSPSTMLQWLMHLLRPFLNSSMRIEMENFLVSSNGFRVNMGKFVFRKWIYHMERIFQAWCGNISSKDWKSCPTICHQWNGLFCHKTTSHHIHLKTNGSIFNRIWR